MNNIFAPLLGIGTFADLTYRSMELGNGKLMLFSLFMAYMMVAIIVKKLEEGK